MENHVHRVEEAPEASLSQSRQSLNAPCSVSCYRRRRRSGQLFQLAIGRGEHSIVKHEDVTPKIYEDVTLKI